VRVISAPKLVVLNNHDADLEVGDEVPITVQTSVSTTDANAPVVSSIQMQDTGVILHVTPRANKSGQIILDVDQEVSNVVATTTSSINSPTIQQRKISTTVAVHDGETVALGGLISDSRSNTRDGIPFLRQLPVLGNLFGSTNKQGTRTELIVLLTPRVIRSSSESEDVMSELESEFKGLKKDLPSLVRKPEEASAPPAATAPN
jgi:general secretion pathway protein D